MTAPTPAGQAPADRGEAEIPYMLADTPEEFERVRSIATDRISIEAAKAAGQRAVRNMPADWYCPWDAQRPRIDCPECIAKVALDAAVEVLRGEGR